LVEPYQTQVDLMAKMAGLMKNLILVSLCRGATINTKYLPSDLILFHLFCEDNEYFGELVGGGGNNNKNTNLETLADGPNWDLIEIDNTGRSFRNMFQWIHSGGGQDNDDCRLRNLQRGGGGGQGKGGSGGGGGGNIKIMLNVDIIAIIRDLGI
jgi:hypothetical protein